MIEIFSTCPNSSANDPGTYARAVAEVARWSERYGCKGILAFQNYKTFCPYLVGSYARVAEELARYVAVGYHTFILDIPPEEQELHHTNIAFSYALHQVAP